MEKKLVSVIIPTYNRRDKICRSIDSVLKQTYQSFEILIIDDYGTDDTEEMLKKVYGNDERIKYRLSKGKKGPAGARNYGMEIAKGEYISFLDSDDEWLSVHLEESLEVLEKGIKQVSFAMWSEKDNFGNEKKMLESDAFIKRIDALVDALHPARISNVYVFDENYFEYASINKAYCTQINTMVFKKEILKTGIRFNDKLMQSEDLDFVLKVIMDHGFCLIMNNHFVYNTSDDSVYHFTDRSLIDIDKTVFDKQAANKIASSCFYKIEHFRDRKQLIMRSPKVINKKDCLKHCNDMIGRKAISLSVIIQKQNKLRSIKYCLFSFLYLKDKAIFQCLLKMLNPFNTAVVIPEISDLNFY